MHGVVPGARPASRSPAAGATAGDQGLLARPGADRIPRWPSSAGGPVPASSLDIRRRPVFVIEQVAHACCKIVVLHHDAAQQVGVQTPRAPAAIRLTAVAGRSTDWYRAAAVLRSTAAIMRGTREGARLEDPSCLRTPIRRALSRPCGIPTRSWPARSSGPCDQRWNRPVADSNWSACILSSGRSLGPCWWPRMSV